MAIYRLGVAKTEDTRVAVQPVFVDSGRLSDRQYASLLKAICEDALAKSDDASLVEIIDTSGRVWPAETEARVNAALGSTSFASGQEELGKIESIMKGDNVPGMTRGWDGRMTEVFKAAFRYAVDPDELVATLLDPLR
jgi:hypothetical protein